MSLSETAARLTCPPGTHPLQTLSDPLKRRTYDSCDDFNDSLPTSLPDDKDFYKVRGRSIPGVY